MDENGKNFPGKPQANEGKDKRPRVTLELKATEIPHNGGARQALPPPDNDDDAKREDTPEEPPRPARGKGAGGAAILTHLAAGLIGGLIALIAAFYGAERFRGRMVAVADSTAEEMKASLYAANARIAALESGGQNQSALEAAAAQIEALRGRGEAADQRAGELAARLTQIESRPGPEAAPPAAISEESLRPLLAPIEERIAALEGRTASLANVQTRQKSSVAATALAVAFSNLRRAAASGKPYAAELDAVMRLGGPAADVEALAARKDTGVPTLETLQKQLTPLVRSALTASYGVKDESFFTRIWLQAKSAIRIRPTGLAEGPAPEAVLARAETYIRNADAASAAKEAGALSGEAGSLLRPWAESAAARAATDATLDRMEANLLALLETEG